MTFAKLKPDRILRGSLFPEQDRPVPGRLIRNPRADVQEIGLRLLAEVPVDSCLGGFGKGISPTHAL